MSDAAHVSAPPAVAGKTLAEGHFVEIAEHSVGQITLRGDLSDKALAGAVKAAIGVGVPGQRQVLFAEGSGAVWMSPDELLLILPRADVAQAVGDIAAALAGRHHMVLDVSDARALLQLRGDLVPELLAKGAPVDLSERAFPVGSCRRSHLGEIAVGFWRREATLWEIVCFRSLSQHLLDWLETASREASRVDTA